MPASTCLSAARGRFALALRRRLTRACVGQHRARGAHAAQVDGVADLRAQRLALAARPAFVFAQIDEALRHLGAQRRKLPRQLVALREPALAVAAGGGEFGLVPGQRLGQ
jgi:hypothetical protein